MTDDSMFPDWYYFYFYTCLLFSGTIIASETVLAVAFVEAASAPIFYFSFLLAPERPDVDRSKGLLLSLDYAPTFLN